MSIAFEVLYHTILYEYYIILYFTEYYITVFILINSFQGYTEKHRR